MRMKTALFPLVLALLWAASAPAQDAPRTPPAGSAERKAVLDALRVPVEKELKRKVVFKVDHLKVQGGWAFMRGVPQQPGGKAMDYRGTEYEQAIREGVFDDWVCALLRKERGRWRVVAHSIGATDVVYANWPEQHNAPRALFDLPEEQ
jgi:hypothetical protein